MSDKRSLTTEMLNEFIEEEMLLDEFVIVERKFLQQLRFWMLSVNPLESDKEQLLKQLTAVLGDDIRKKITAEY
jgi:hypothetical protein